jgi:Tfp pilus assembly protein PilF
MDKRLTAYLWEGGLTLLEMARPTAKVKISRCKLTTAETSYVKAHSSYEVGKYEKAFYYIKKVEDTNPDAARSLILNALMSNQRGGIG